LRILPEPCCTPYAIAYVTTRVIAYAIAYVTTRVIAYALAHVIAHVLAYALAHVIAHVLTYAFTASRVTTCRQEATAIFCTSTTVGSMLVPPPVYHQQVPATGEHIGEGCSQPVGTGPDMQGYPAPGPVLSTTRAVNIASRNIAGVTVVG
jgi:hypothetical protein